MGMFDHVRCLYPLPEGAPDGNAGWQTKDTEEQYLHLYEIREDGTLWRYPWRIETVEGAPERLPTDDYFEWDRKHTRRVDDPPVQVKMTGAVNFYTMRGSNPTEWWEFCALYDQGRLLALRQVSPPTDEAPHG